MLCPTPNDITAPCPSPMTSHPMPSSNDLGLLSAHLTSKQAYTHTTCLLPPTPSHTPTSHPHPTPSLLPPHPPYYPHTIPTTPTPSLLPPHPPYYPHTIPTTPTPSLLPPHPPYYPHTLPTTPTPSPTSTWDDNANVGGKPSLAWTVRRNEPTLSLSSGVVMVMTPEVGLIENHD